MKLNKGTVRKLRGSELVYELEKAAGGLARCGIAFGMLPSGSDSQARKAVNRAIGQLDLLRGELLRRLGEEESR